MILLLLLFVTSCVSEQPCTDYESVDLSDVKSSKDGSIVRDGVVFPPKYVYSKKVDGEMRTYGCLCQNKKCFRKCCRVGYIYHKMYRCTNMTNYDLLLTKGLDTYDIANFKKNVDIKTEFDLLYGTPCAGYIEGNKWYVQEDGKLYVHAPNNIPDSFLFGPDKYCIDTFILDKDYTEPRLNAFVCFIVDKEVKTFPMSSSCMLISCFFILLTVAVYAWVPELHNLHGMVLVAYLLSFFVAFLFMATMQILILRKSMPKDICAILTFITYFSLLSAFFWLNVMCYDIWWTFSGKRAHGQERSIKKRFLHYAIYAFGVPTVLTILLASLEFSTLEHGMLPKIRAQGCFLYGFSKILYFCGPIVILCVANMTFFTMTAFKIWKSKKETNKALHSRDSSTNDQNRKDTQRFTLYVKLFTVMGINWIMEVVGSLYPDAIFIWQFFDAYNVLVGLILFIIFVCKRKTINLIRTRYETMRALQMSRTPATTSTSTRTTSQPQEEIQLNSITKLPD